jgi:MFS transporter, ACDE family, multidrug resistance protein
VFVALFAALVAPRLQAGIGTARTQYANFLLMALDLLVIAVWTGRKAVLITAVIVSGAFIGLSDTLMTQAVMRVSPVDRSVASASYGFVPFYLGVAMLIVAIGVLATGHRPTAAADDMAAAPSEDEEAAEETGEMISVGPAD